MASRLKRPAMQLGSDDEDEDIFSESSSPKSKKKRGDEPDLPNLVKEPHDFVKPLTECGFFLRSGILPNLLNVHQTDFQQKLRDHFFASCDFPRNVDYFVTQADEFFDDHDSFVKALQPTENASASAESQGHVVLPQDSLVRLLLNIDEMQPKLMRSLLTRLTEAAGRQRSPKEANLPSLILSQMVWLNRVADPTHVVETLLDLLNSCRSLEVQRELISQLPGLVADREQVRVAQNLADMIGEQTELTAAILDALGDLNLPAAKAAQVRDNVVKLLPAVPTDAIPVLLTFVLKRIGADEAPTLVRHVRAQLDRALVAGAATPAAAASSSSSTAAATPHKKTSSQVNCIALTVEALQNSLIRSKVLADQWLRTIQLVDRAEEHVCADLLVLVVQHKLTGRRRGVESLLRRKMRLELLTADLVRRTFQTYASVLKDFFEQLRSMADSLLLSREPLAVAAGSLLYKQMFQHFDSYFQQEVVLSLIRHVSANGGGDGESSPATAAVLALNELALNEWDAMVQQSAFVVSILEYLDYMPLPQVKRVMELLARIGYGYSVEDQTKSRWANFSASVRSELSMLIKKQLHHTRVEFVRMGVLGCVALVQCLADPELVGAGANQLQLSANESATPASLSQSTAAGDLPDGEQRLKQARHLMDMARRCTEQKPDVAALFMDEMANAVLVYELHPALQSCLYDLVAESFQEQFVVDESDQDLAGLPIEVTLQYGLDSSEENPDVNLVFVNLSPMVIREDQQQGRKNHGPMAARSKSTIVTLMSHFRLLRNTIQSLGELDDIDALLGCSVCLPSSECVDDFVNLSTAHKDLVCRCLFYGVNWFIEVINTFARTKNPQMRTKVVQRLRHIVQLKETLLRCLQKHGSFVAPPSVFSCQPVRSRAAAAETAAAKTAGAKGRPKKGSAAAKKAAAAKEKAKAAASQATQQKSFLTSTQNQDATNLNFTLADKDVDGEADGGSAGPNAAMASIHRYFREFDLVAFILLSSQLDCTNGEPEDASCLQSKELELLLDDLALKVEHRLLPAGLKKRFGGPTASAAAASTEDSTFQLLDLYPPPAVAKRCVSLFRRLCPHLETISGHFQQLMEASDGIMDGPTLFTELALRLSHCYQLLLRVLNAVISWNEFQKAEHRPLLADAFKTLAGRIHDAELTEATTLNQLNQMAFAYVEKFSGAMPHFQPAVEHVQLLKSILNRMEPPERQLSGRLASIAKGYLKRCWSAGGEPEKGAKFNQGVETMLQAYLFDGDVLAKVHNVIGTALAEVLERGGGARDADASDTFPTCTGNSFAVYYRAVFGALNEASRRISDPYAADPFAGADDEPTPTPDADAQLKSWQKSIGLLGEMVAAVKTIDKRAVLTSCLRYGRQYVEIFLKWAMPLLDKQFKHNQPFCQSLLKNLQLSTRTLQHVCTHAKTSRDASLAAYVPAMKKTLESFLYRVKAMLATNGQAGAFWLGNLKNRNLQGDEIISQSTVASQQDSSDNDGSSSDGGTGGGGGGGGGGSEEEEEEAENQAVSDDEVTALSPVEDQSEEERESISPDF